MKIQMLTTQNLVDIYKLRTEKKIGYGVIAQQLGLNQPAVWYGYNHLVRVMRGNAKTTMKTYKDALRIIQLNTQQIETVVPVQSNILTSMERLDKAFTALQNAIADVIVEEVDLRSAKKVAEAEKALVDEREKANQEMLRLQEIIVQAKDSSILGVIQRKWGQTPSKV